MNLLLVLNRIREFEIRYHRKPHSVKLLAVTKNQSVEKIQEAFNAGQLYFGESYLQEALPKIMHFQNQNIEWHFIGPIQSNKTKKIAEHFSWVQSVDSFKIAKRLNDQRPDHLPPLNICLQVNISHETSKSGMYAQDVFALAEDCQSLPRLNLRGLMTIPAPEKNFSDQCIPLHALKILFDELIHKNFSLDTLSMGMSDDMEAAISEGSTLVRIGTGIFGRK